MPQGDLVPGLPIGIPAVVQAFVGVLYLLVPLGMFFNRSLRQMDTRRRDAPGPAPAVE